MKTGYLRKSIETALADGIISFPKELPLSDNPTVEQRVPKERIDRAYLRQLSGAVIKEHAEAIRKEAFKRL